VTGRTPAFRTDGGASAGKRARRTRARVELARYQRIIPEWARFLEVASTPEPTVFRVREGRVGEGELLARLDDQGFRVRPVEGLPSFFRVDEGPRPISHTLEHWSGHLYVQQASTGVAAPSLGPKSGERVLDLCASPGGKATHLAELMRDTGCLVASEVDERRVRGLLGNFYRLCVPNALVVAGDGRAFPEGALFDRVLVDAPCTGEGTLRRRSGEVLNQSKAFLAYVTASQRALLEQAVRLTRPGGTVLYVTCTFAPEENEAIVSAVLERAPVDLEPIELLVPHAPGLTSFEGAKYDPRLEGAVRIYPHHLDSGGLFMVKLRRREGAAASGRAAGAWYPLPYAFPGDDRAQDEAHTLVEEAVAEVLERHGIAAAALGASGWTLRGETVWMHRCSEWPVPAWEPGSWRVVSVGLRAIEIDTRGRPRATNDLLRYASASVRSAVDVGREGLSGLLRGGTSPAQATARLGPVALRLGAEVLGRGAVTRAGLVSEIPKARARELERALEVPT
jgi:NOL1/NOP2/sun family putative RNA methylase